MLSEIHIFVLLLQENMEIDPPFTSFGTFFYADL